MKLLKAKLESTNTDSFGISTEFSRTQKSRNRFIANTSKTTLQTQGSELPTLYKIRSRVNKKSQRTSECFNVYKAPQSLEVNHETLHRKSKQYRLSQNIIKYYNDEMISLRDQKSLEETDVEKAILKYINDAQLSNDILIKKLQNMFQHKCNREKSEVEMKEIIQECFKAKNVCIQQRICYVFGKMEQLFYNPIQGAIYYKICKRLSDNEQYFRNKMKAYRGLGECLLRVRPKLSQLYFTKYLMSAWKLNEINHELYAYDLLGKYYFYVGQIEKAKLFHEKMIGGYCEQSDSRVRILAQSRLEQGSLGNRINREHQIVDIDSVSSDEECYEIVLTQPQKITTTSQNSDLFQQGSIFKRKTTDPSEIIASKTARYFQRKIPDQKQVKEEANTHIRQPKHHTINNFDTFDPSKLVISNPHLNIGTIKDRVLISHMSPNRKLEMYQYLCLASDKNAINNVNQLSGLYDKFESTKITRYLNKLVSLLQTVQSWLSTQSKISGAARRGAVF